MKKTLFTLFLISQFLTVYTQSVDTPPDSLPQISITLNIPNAYFSETFSGDLLIADANGVQLERIELEDMKTYNLSYPGELVYMTFVKRQMPGNIGLSMHTYIVTEDLDLSIGTIPNRNLEGETIHIDNNGLRTGAGRMITNTGSYRGSGNDIYFKPTYFPTDLLVSMNLRGVPQRKVYYQPNVDASFSGSFILEELLDVADSTVIQYPENKSSYSDLMARRSWMDPYFYMISEDHGGMKTEHQHFLPLPELDEFLLKTSLVIDNKMYVTREHFTSFEFSYSLPDIDFTVESASLDSVVLSGGEECQYFSSFFRYMSDPNYSVLWSIYGSFEDTVTLSPPNLEPYIQSLHPSFSISDLQYIHSVGYRVADSFGMDAFFGMNHENFYLRKRTDKMESLKIKN